VGVMENRGGQSNIQVRGGMNTSLSFAQWSFQLSLLYEESIKK
jgi:hypothetical protein